MDSQMEWDDVGWLLLSYRVISVTGHRCHVSGCVLDWELLVDTFAASLSLLQCDHLSPHCVCVYPSWVWTGPVLGHSGGDGRSGVLCLLRLGHKNAAVSTRTHLCSKELGPWCGSSVMDSGEQRWATAPTACSHSWSSEHMSITVAASHQSSAESLNMVILYINMIKYMSLESNYI